MYFEVYFGHARGFVVCRGRRRSQPCVVSRRLLEGPLGGFPCTGCTEALFCRAIEGILNTPLSGLLRSEEDKRATTNVRNGLVFIFLFSFIIFSYL